MKTTLKPTTWLSICYLLTLPFYGCDSQSTDPEQGQIYGIVYDALSYQVLEGGVVSVYEASGENNQNPLYVTTTDNTGSFTIDEIKKGTYYVKFDLNGYKSMYIDIVEIGNKDIYLAFVPSPNTLVTPIGGITGSVINQDGDPVSNTNISIAAQDEGLTNGYFSSVTTNESGEFFIGAIPLQEQNKFKVRSIADGYQSVIQNNITILQNEMVAMQIILEPGNPETILYEEGFENDGNGWQTDGFWHVQNNASIANKAFPGYVKLAPNDNSNALIPDAYKGASAAWYGNESTGNYIGSQSEFDYECSGGSSENKNSGNLISPAINLQSATAASLTFWAWFEIESVNPNQTGYDLMEVWILESNGNPVKIGKLNPYTDPIIPERKPIPFTSGGFNQSPVWKFHEYDISKWTGTKIRLQFRFETRDNLYNGFRGWFIDDITILNRPPENTTKSLPFNSGQLMPSRTDIR